MGGDKASFQIQRGSNMSDLRARLWTGRNSVMRAQARLLYVQEILTDDNIDRYLQDTRRLVSQDRPCNVSISAGGTDVHTACSWNIRSLTIALHMWAAQGQPARP